MAALVHTGLNGVVPLMTAAAPIPGRRVDLLESGWLHRCLVQCRRRTRGRVAACTAKPAASAPASPSATFDTAECPMRALDT